MLNFIFLSLNLLFLIFYYCFGTNFYVFVLNLNLKSSKVKELKDMIFIFDYLIYLNYFNFIRKCIIF